MSRSESEDQVVAISSNKEAKLAVRKDKNVSSESEEEGEPSAKSVSERDDESSY